MFNRVRFVRLFVILTLLVAQGVFAITADEAMEKSKAWFK
jgi:outer membrane lipoprotein carrier protein